MGHKDTQAKQRNKMFSVLHLRSKALAPSHYFMIYLSYHFVSIEVIKEMYECKLTNGLLQEVCSQHQTKPKGTLRQIS